MYRADEQKTARGFWPFFVPRQLTESINMLCGREDLNLHELAPTSPSSWRVYQFRHCRE